MTPDTLTTEQKLATIIARYRPEEDETWHNAMRKTIMDSDLVKDRFRLMGILLDPNGLRAAFPGYVSSIGGLPGEGNIATADLVPLAPRVAHRILDAWLTGGLDPAIDTVYSLLSHP